MSFLSAHTNKRTHDINHFHAMIMFYCVNMKNTTLFTAITTQRRTAKFSIIYLNKLFSVRGGGISEVLAYVLKEVWKRLDRA